MARQFPPDPPPPELRSSPSLPPPTANLLGVFDSILDVLFNAQRRPRAPASGITLARLGLFFSHSHHSNRARAASSPQAIAKPMMQRCLVVLALCLGNSAGLNPIARQQARPKMAAPLQKAAQTNAAIARAAGTVAASLALAWPTTSFAAICDYAPTSDLCAQERQREALKPKAKGDKGKGPAMAIAKPVAKPAPPPVKLTKEAQAVADAEATIAKMEKQKKDMTAQCEAAPTPSTRRGLRS